MSEMQNTQPDVTEAYLAYIDDAFALLCEVEVVDDGFPPFDANVAEDCASATCALLAAWCALSVLDVPVH